MILDAGSVEPAHTALVGARNLDPPEEMFIAANGIRTEIEPALTDRVYVAFDLDVLDPADSAPFMPEPEGISLAAAGALLNVIAARADVVGIGFTGATPDPVNQAVIEHLLSAVAL